MIKFSFGQVEASVWKNTSGPCFYTHLPGEIAKMLGVQAEGRYSIINFSGIHWERDMTPWPAENISPGKSAFSGQADVYLRQLTECYIPEIEKTCGISAKRFLAGYSLSALFSLYALYRCNLFSGAACISGSFWYDRFLDYTMEHELMCSPDILYFSLGAQEKKTRNTRMARVETCTRQIVALFQKQGIPTLFRLEPGNHFFHTAERITNGIFYLTNFSEFPGIRSHPY